MMRTISIGSDTSHRQGRVLLLVLAAIVAFLACVAVYFNQGQFPEGGATGSDDSTATGDLQEDEGARSRVRSGIATGPPTTERDAQSTHVRQRQRMVDEDLAARDIRNQRVLAAMRKVPRHRLVPKEFEALAYADRPLPIGHQQTISQPYIVALMTQLVEPQPEHRALDIGTGSGYQAAVLAELVKEVYSIEIVKPLANQARQKLKELGYKNVHVRHGDGYQGWPEHAPFDVIIVAAAPDHVPQPLIDQLAPGGRLVIPVGNALWQDLLVLEKDATGDIRRRKVAPVAFVPMTGEARRPKNGD